MKLFPQNLDFRKGIITFLLTTGGEFVALSAWIYYINLENPLQAHLLLWGGFLIERVAVIRWAAGFHSSSKFIHKSLFIKTTGIFAITLAEVLIWLIWYFSYLKWGHLFAFIILIILMQIEHAVEMALLKTDSIIKHIFSCRTALFTLFETVGAAIGLYFFVNNMIWAAALALFVGLSVEHTIQGAGLKPKHDNSFASQNKNSG